MKGIQYDLATGVITGCCTPAIDTIKQPMPEGRGQLVVDDGIDYVGMKVDIAQTPPIMVADLG